MDLQEIKNILGAKKEYYHEKYGVSELAVFGSYTRDDYTEDSDIDIMVSFDRRIGLGFVRLAREIEEHLGKKVDLVSKRGIKPRYFEYIKEDLSYV